MCGIKCVRSSKRENFFFQKKLVFTQKNPRKEQHAQAKEDRTNSWERVFWFLFQTNNHFLFDFVTRKINLNFHWYRYQMQLLIRRNRTFYVSSIHWCVNSSVFFFVCLFVYLNIRRLFIVDFLFLLHILVQKVIKKNLSSNIVVIMYIVCSCLFVLYCWNWLFLYRNKTKN